MTEAEFQRHAIELLANAGNVCLRVCDGTDARFRKYGLRIVGGPSIGATGPDLLVLQRGDIPVIRTASMDRIRDYARHRGGPVMFELKTEEEARRNPKNSEQQRRWVEVVAGGYSE